MLTTQLACGKARKCMAACPQAFANPASLLHGHPVSGVGRQAPHHIFTSPRPPQVLQVNRCSGPPPPTTTGRAGPAPAQVLRYILDHLPLTLAVQHHLSSETSPPMCVCLPPPPHDPEVLALSFSAQSSLILQVTVGLGEFTCIENH